MYLPRPLNITPDVVIRRVSLLELDVAQALLDFHNQVYVSKERDVQPSNDEEMINESPNEIIASDVEEQLQLVVTAPKSEINPRNKECRSCVHAKPSTRDVATQTDELCSVYDPKRDACIKELNERVKSLEAQLQAMNKDPPDNDRNVTDKPNTDDKVPTSEFHENDEKPNKRTTKTKRQTSAKSTDGPSRTAVNSRQVLASRIANAEANDMIPIGEGKAKVPARILRQINWNCYTIATRKLLTAVFSRRVLATHSLTGKRAVAFPMKPPKKQLDAALVNDIVQTVAERCGVQESVVRSSVTIKCADESKMLRNRLNKNKDKNNIDKENCATDSELD